MMTGKEDIQSVDLAEARWPAGLPRSQGSPETSVMLRVHHLCTLYHRPTPRVPEEACALAAARVSIWQYKGHQLPLLA